MVREAFAACPENGYRERVARGIGDGGRDVVPIFGYRRNPSPPAPAPRRPERGPGGCTEPTPTGTGTLLPAHDRLVPVLEQMSAAAVALVEGHGVPREEPAHERGQRHVPTPKQQVHMVRQQRPGQALGAGVHQEQAQPGTEPLPILLVAKDHLAGHPRTITCCNSPGRSIRALLGIPRLLAHLAPIRDYAAASPCPPHVLAQDPACLNRLALYPDGDTVVEIGNG